ncbi:DUF1460 domain-containing protein [Pseudomonas sp. SDO528_S397]
MKHQMKYAYLLCVLLLVGCSLSPRQPPTPAVQEGLEKPSDTQLKLDDYTSLMLDKLLRHPLKSPNSDAGELIGAISGQFLGTPYEAHRLRGSKYIPEELVIDFRGLDCFTYLDYVEALRVSSSRSSFIAHLIKTRYFNGQIDFLKRKHFFTDWAQQEGGQVATDITAHLGGEPVRVEKNLNEKADGGHYLPGLPVVKREVIYIPADQVNEQFVSRLRTGDLIGLYTPLAGLDVTHVGFFILTDKGPVLRNASSRKNVNQVIDYPFIEYVAKTPGIVVLRVKAR